MKQGIIYGGTFLFAFVIVTGLLIYLNSSYENIFQFNFASKSTVQLSDSTKTDSLKIVENSEPIPEVDSTVVQDSILLSSLLSVEENDSTLTEKIDNKNAKNQPENSNPIKENKNDVKNDDKSDSKTNTTTNLQSNIKPEVDNEAKNIEYNGWVKKITSIYSSMEPKKAAKIIQTYSDNVARDILYNMNKKAAAKVVSEFSPETANRIIRFE